MNALFLKDLAQNTRRGLRGRVEAGRSGGGNSYGYDVVRTTRADGTVDVGERRPNLGKANIVRRIFHEYNQGVSPREIAKMLNREGISGPLSACTNHLTIRGDEIELAILAGLKERLMEPALFEAFAREFTAEMNRQRSALASEKKTLEGELERVRKQIDKLVDAIIEGANALAVNAKLTELEGQTAALEDKLAATPEAEPLLHPALATIYRNVVEELETLLRQPDTRWEAFGLIRGLIDAVMLTPVDGKLEIELRGDLAGILAMSEAGKASTPSPKEKALQIKMVAGVRGPATTYTELDSIGVDADISTYCVVHS